MGKKEVTAAEIDSFRGAPHTPWKTTPASNTTFSLLESARRLDTADERLARQEGPMNYPATGYHHITACAAGDCSLATSCGINHYEQEN